MVNFLSPIGVRISLKTRCTNLSWLWACSCWNYLHGFFFFHKLKKIVLRINLLSTFAGKKPNRTVTWTPWQRRLPSRRRRGSRLDWLHQTWWLFNLCPCRCLKNEKKIMTIFIHFVSILSDWEFPCVFSSAFHKQRISAYFKKPKKTIKFRCFGLYFLEPILPNFHLPGFPIFAVKLECL